VNPSLLQIDPKRTCVVDALDHGRGQGEEPAVLP
jgi:hypothetical protein